MLIRFLPEMIFAIVLSLLAAKAHAQDQNLEVCARGGLYKIEFTVKGESATLTMDGEKMDFTVIKSEAADKDTLAVASRIVREEAVSGVGYALTNKDGNDALFVITGKSGYKYLFAVDLGIEILGSDRIQCR